MNEYLSALILGIVEGLTEFLPVSSTGHLILVNQWVRLPQPFSNMFNIFIQLGAILAVVIFFWNRLIPFQPGLVKEQRTRIWNLWGRVGVAVLPAYVLAFLFHDYLEQYLMTPLVVAGALLFYGVILILLERRSWNTQFEDPSDMPWKIALFIGLFQVLALVPGTSRSAVTIIGALILGLNRKAAAEFSFFLGVPTLGAASLYSLLKYEGTLGAQEWGLLGVGFLVSFMVAWGVIAFFMNWVSKKDFQVFGWYRVVLGGLLLGLWFWAPQLFAVL